MNKVSRLFTRSKSVKEALLAVSKISLGSIEGAKNALSRGEFSNSALAATANDFRKFLVRFMSADEAEKLSSIIMFFERILERGDGTPEAIDAALRDFYSSEAADLEPRFVDVLASFIGDEETFVIYKTSELFFDADNSLEILRILTENRPVFNKAADQIVGYIIRNVLTIEKNGVVDERLDVALSVRELEQLVRTATRALQKTKLLERDLRQRGASKVAIYGAQYNLGEDYV